MIILERNLGAIWAPGARKLGVKRHKLGRPGAQLQDAPGPSLCSQMLAPPRYLHRQQRDRLRT